MNNSMMVINPYRKYNTWVFDDERVGLVEEPFVSGIPEMVDILVNDTPNAHEGFRLLFSEKPFPEFGAKLDWTHAETGGDWYHWAKHDMNGWLCPALRLYFVADAPKELYLKAEPII